MRTGSDIKNSEWETTLTWKFAFKFLIFYFFIKQEQFFNYQNVLACNWNGGHRTHKFDLFFGAIANSLFVVGRCFDLRMLVSWIQSTTGMKWRKKLQRKWSIIQFIVIVDPIVERKGPLTLKNKLLNNRDLTSINLPWQILAEIALYRIRCIGCCIVPYCFLLFLMSCWYEICLIIKQYWVEP